MDRRTLLALAALALCLLSNCRKNDLDSAPEVPVEDLIVQYIDDSLREAFNTAVAAQAGCLQMPAPINEPQPNGTAYTDTSVSGPPSSQQTWSCQTQPMIFGPGFSEASIFSPSEIMWVGSFLKGSSISNGAWTPIVYQGRAPVTLTTSLNTGGQPSSAPLNAPSLSQYNAAHNALIQNTVLGGTPTTILYETHEVKAEQEAKGRIGFGAGANFGLWGGSITGSYSWNSNQTMSRFMLKLVQQYYTMDVDMLAQPDDWFGTNNLPSHQQMADFNLCPVYISSISYGRVVYITIESSSSRDSVNSAIQATWNAWGANGTMDFSTSQWQALQDKSINVFAIGGSPNGVMETITTGDLSAFLNSGAQFDPSSSPGAPIAFKVRRLSDNSIVDFVALSEYSVRECELLGTTVQVDPGTTYWPFCPIQQSGIIPNTNNPAGDDNFDDNGPSVYGTVTLDHSDTEVFALVNVHFVETASDWTWGWINPAIAANRVVLYQAPPGKRISSIGVNPVYNVGPWIDTDGWAETLVPTPNSGFIHSLKINGRTDGADLQCSGTAADSYLKIRFKPFTVTLVDD